jgi:hypothetical protein
MALAWDGTLVICDNPDCGSSQRVPGVLVRDESSSTEDWLRARAWTTIAGRHYCPEHW